ncbi:unnamed protein product [Cochlearia groenlandica]
MQASSLQRGLDKLIVGGDLPDPSVDDMLSIIRTPNDPNSNHLSDDGECDRTPPGPHGSKLNHVSDESQKIDADLVQSPNTMVRNVVADINAMAVEDSMGRDGSRTVVEPVLEDVEDTLNEVVVEGKREKNSTLGDDKSPHEPDPITNEDLTSPNVKCPGDVLVSPEFNLMHQDEEEQVIMLGYTSVFEVPEVQDPIQPPHTDGGESPNVMESTGPVQEGDVDMQPPTNVSSHFFSVYVVNYIFS